MGPAQAPGARAERCISLGLMFVLSLFSERSGQERWVSPYWVLSRDEEIVAGVDGQCRDILHKLFELNVLFAEFVEGLQSVAIFPTYKSSCSHFKGTEMRCKLRDISQEVRVLVFLKLVRVGEGFVSVKARRQLKDVEVAGPSVDDNHVGPVRCQTGRGGDGAAVGGLVPREIGVHLEPRLVQALGNVLDNSVMSEAVPALVERYLTGRKQVVQCLTDTAAGERTLVGGRLAPRLQVGVGWEGI